MSPIAAAVPVAVAAARASAVASICGQERAEARTLRSQFFSVLIDVVGPCACSIPYGERNKAETGRCGSTRPRGPI